MGRTTPAPATHSRADDSSTREALSPTPRRAVAAEIRVIEDWLSFATTTEAGAESGALVDAAGAADGSA